jgi:predicted ABC-type ATPase
MISEVLKPSLIIIAGPNGSGKTTITSQILKHDWTLDSVYINPDEIAQNQFGDWNNSENSLKAAVLSEKMRHECIKNRTNLIFETVFSRFDKIEFIELAKKEGYFIRFFFVSTSHPSINAARITRRVLEGGHDVPIPKIIDRYFKSISNSTLILSIVDRFYLFDNSIESENATLILRASNGKLTKKYSDYPDWSLPIINKLNEN